MSKIATLTLSLLIAFACNLAVADEVSKDFQAEYDQIAKMIGQFANEDKLPPSKRQPPIEQSLDINSRILKTDRNPLDVATRRCDALLKRLKTVANAPKLDGLAARLAEIKKQAANAPADKIKPLFLAVRAITRQAAFSNPLIDFNSILYVERGNCGKGNWGGQHMTTVWFGHTQEYGGGLYIVKDIKSGKPKIVNVVENSVVAKGALKGQKLTGGAFCSPELSYDAKEILFAYAKPVYAKGAKRPWEYTAENSLHIFKVNVDGTNLVQLTEGNNNDFDPCWLPGGRIAFMSTRTESRGIGRIYPRCFIGRSPQQFFMHSMKADGSDVIPLSYHETDEWQPSVNNDGMIVYTRWDYVDRNSNAAQHLWTCFPDGRDPRSSHGNYVHPFSTWQPGRKNFGPGVFTTRPCCEWHIRAVPRSESYNGSSLYVACAGPHHGEPFGPLVLIDTSIEDDGLMSQVKRITTGRFPESEVGSKQSWNYGAPWPLSDEFYVVNYLDGLYVLDKFGNRDLICKTTNKAHRPTEPMPLKPRPKPPILPIQTHQGQRANPDAPPATIRVMNAYITDLPYPKGTKLKELRIIQYFPKTTEKLFNPRIGFAEQTLARIVLGTVPVDEDGSINFQAPVGKGISFQLIDETGMAVQAMRSLTYVHPGEQMTCIGCHESKWTAPPLNPRATALRRAPSKITPDAGGLEPINFHRLVKPVLEAKCTPCHKEKKKKPDMTYKSLQKYCFYLVGGKPSSGRWLTIPMHGGSRSIPGKHGAYGAPLTKYLDKSHYKVNLTKEQRRRITLWLDCNSNEIGAYHDEETQRQGKIVWPTLDCDPKNLQGIETRKPASK